MQVFRGDSCAINLEESTSVPIFSHTEQILHHEADLLKEERERMRKQALSFLFNMLLGCWFGVCMVEIAIFKTVGLSLAHFVCVCNSSFYLFHYW